MLLDCAETASRSPELDSQAIAISSWSGLSALPVISVFDPQELPSQIQARVGDPVAVTGGRIPLHELRYWSVERQEAYVDAEASLEAEQRSAQA